ncbi:Quinate/shikimate dehydrogenase (quinone) [Pirellulimonas nuda]|uniref:Quinate/shikimate dehydrogenase (Quinone) n=1 Tax=Pirellulimonas nuda TaxID=2528009 RepID=A0A518DE59_9BACT|nr:pyrroloquinoline quinone-dependent dehydrogenase [Pirellulimonas nuda]QDU89722.1 Quinate/shikimate dehydrogenase (quinone) [Pirellulimonas nuda]
MNRRRRLVVWSILVSGVTAAGAADWPVVGGDAAATRHSHLDQIDRSNVARLETAWTFHTGEAKDGVGPTIECTPIIVDGVMYVTTGNRVLVALDAATGQERWRFDPSELPWPHAPTSGGVNRGCAYWSDGAPNGARRVLHGVADGRLFSVDARTGRLDPAFGAGGMVDLRRGMNKRVAKLGYGPTSAPAVWRDAVIVGCSCGEGPGIAAPGDVLAFDVRTGREAWRFRTVPQPGEFGAETWEGDSWRDRGGANAWSGLTVDDERGLVFAGLGSASFDFYGGDRKGENLFANCTIALDARSGERVWHFQTVRHDLCDHDLPTPPNLVTIPREDGGSIDAAVQVTKTGYVYVFDRATGRPLFDIVETPAAASDVPGEAAWPTQPIPARPPALVTTRFDESTVTNIGPENRRSVLDQLAGLRHGDPFLPPSLEGTVVLPGFHGGANWSGASYDRASGLLYVNVTNCPNVMTLIDRGEGADRYGPYAHRGYRQLRDHEGYPAVAPPWGELIAVDLVRGEIAWRVALGEYPELTARGVPKTGTESFGGTIVTAGGLVFIAGTKDERFRAFDKSTGETLWETQLPAGGYATPATYDVGGRQFIVIAAGGAGKQGTKAGDAFIAFALPE